MVMECGIYAPMPPWLRMLPRPKTTLPCGPPTATLRRTSILWRFQRRPSGPLSAWIIKLGFERFPSADLGLPALLIAAYCNSNQSWEKQNRSLLSWACSLVQPAVHLCDQRLPHLDLQLELVLERRLRGIHKSQICLHLLDQRLHACNVFS